MFCTPCHARMLVRVADLLLEQREQAANLCYTLAQAHLDMLPPDEEKARIYFSEAVKVLRALQRIHDCCLSAHGCACRTPCRHKNHTSQRCLRLRSCICSVQSWSPAKRFANPCCG